MKTTNDTYAIYKYDFHLASQCTVMAEAAKADGKKNLLSAQTHFESIFDENTVGNLAKKGGKGEATLLPNDIMAKRNGIFAWRVNNSQMMRLWLRDGSKDGRGKDRYEERALESNPYCMVLIDNRPGHCIMAIQKSAAWGGKPDRLRDVLLKNFNRILEEKGLEMRIQARMSVKEIWDFMNERIHDHNDYVKKVEFTFQNPDRISPTNGTGKRSPYIEAMTRTLRANKAIGGVFGMVFDKDCGAEFSQKNRDLAEMVLLCGTNGYDISVTFKDYKVYRINDYVRAYFQLGHDYLQDFAAGQRTLDDSTDLEQWFDRIIEETKSYVNESEAPRRRNLSRA